MRHMKSRCAACERFGVNMTKEHFYPEWLIKKTRTDKTGMNWRGNKIPNAMTATIPLCEDCNRDFGALLEAPTSKLFDEIERGNAISDEDAELIVRWMWKLEGLHWRIEHTSGAYTTRYTIRERVLNPIDDVRPKIVLAIARIGHIQEKHGDLPLGLDWYGHFSAIFTAGVFSKLAIVVLERDFIEYVPRAFTIYTLKKIPDSEKKIVFGIGFRDDSDAVTLTLHTSALLGRLHDSLSMRRDVVANRHESIFDAWMRKRRSFD